MKNMARRVVLAMLLMASQGAIADVSFYGDWESGTVIGEGNTNWRSVDAVAPDRFTLISDGVRPGTFARIEVRNGDNPLVFCCEDSDRAEVARMQNPDGSNLGENLTSGTQQYRFSVKFDDGWQIIDSPNGGAFGIFLQLHGPNAYRASPALAFSATDQVRFNMLVGDIDDSKVEQHDLAKGALNDGHWIDFDLTVRFAADDTGFVRIMRRDEGDASFSEVLNVTDTPTLQYSSSYLDGVVLDHYWKHGLYRNRQDFTSVLYLDGMTRQVATVPEPQTYALLLVGLCLVGLGAKRYSRLRRSVSITLLQVGEFGWPSGLLGALGQAAHGHGIQRTLA